jgi:hypothetical protein
MSFAIRALDQRLADVRPLRSIAPEETPEAVPAAYPVTGRAQVVFAPREGRLGGLDALDASVTVAGPESARVSLPLPFDVWPIAVESEPDVLAAVFLEGPVIALAPFTRQFERALLRQLLRSRTVSRWARRDPRGRHRGADTRRAAPHLRSRRQTLLRRVRRHLRRGRLLRGRGRQVPGVR